MISTQVLHTGKRNAAPSVNSLKQESERFGGYGNTVYTLSTLFTRMPRAWHAQTLRPACKLWNLFFDSRVVKLSVA